ncbi:DUF4381 domain-containing protein [Xanthobacter sediminis]
MAQDLILPPERPPVTLDPGADPLARLRDIHLPDAVAFWPPAPGWFAAAGLVLVVVLAAVFLEWRRRQTLAYRALRDFKAAARGGDTLAVGAAAAVLVRRVLLSRDPQAAAAAFTGDAFARFLGAGPKGVPPEIGRFLARAPYLPPGAAEAAEIDRAALIAAVRRWIRGHA